MNILITYDVSDRQTEVKQKMLETGYYDKWAANEKTYYLPQSTLWKKDVTDLKTALIDLRKVIENLNLYRTNQPLIELRRCIVVSANPWDGIEGIPN